MGRYIAAWLALAIGAKAAQADNREDCLQDKDHNLSIRGCSEITRDDPLAAWAYFNRGIAYRGKGDNDPAMVDFGKAIELDPKNATYYNNRGASYFSKGDKDKAIADFRKVLSVDPASELARSNLRRLGVNP